MLAADGAAVVHEPDGVEVERVEWFPHEKVHELIRTGAIGHGFSLTALLWYLSVEIPT